MVDTKLNTDIEKMSSYEHCRFLPSMYFGEIAVHTGIVPEYENNEIRLIENSWVPAVFTCVREIIDNALDEIVVHGFGNKISVWYDEITKIVQVSDNGRGIPIDWDEEQQMHKATLALSEMLAGRNFKNRSFTAGMHGIGAAGVNYCSEFFKVDIVHNGKRFIQEFHEGNDGEKSLQTSKPKITNKNGNSGTTILFKLSNKVFKDQTLPGSFIKNRLVEIASCNPQIKIYFNDEKIAVKNTFAKTLFEKYHYIPIQIDVNNEFKSKFLIVPDMLESSDHSYSLLNNIPILNGGSQIDSFKRHFISGLKNALTRESKRRNLYPNNSDILDGTYIFGVINMKDPKFSGQNKAQLATGDVDKWIREYFENTNVFRGIIRQNQEWIERIYKRCEERTRSKEDLEISRASKKLLRTKVPMLMDATGRDRTKCQLLIAEGNSAVASTSAVRNPEIHGAMPIRGKLMNVRGESPKRLIENEVISNLMVAIGLSLGQPAVRNELRYGKVLLACDQDQDGANITALLINFFYLHWPELFNPKQEPYFFIFQTPFIIQEYKGKRHYWYANDYQNYNPKDWKNAPKPIRAKGLGSLEEIDWKNSLENPKVIPVLEDSKLSDLLTLIFDTKLADERKKWIALN